MNYVTGVSATGANVSQSARGTSSKVRLTVNGLTSQVEVWLNGAKIAVPSKTENLGTTSIGRIVVRKPAAGHNYSFAIDDVFVDTNP